MIPAVADAVSNYKTVKGVLPSDYFEVYPFEDKSLDIGFSKYGEFISLDTLGLAGDAVGLQYPGADTPGVGTYDQSDLTIETRDPFANELVSMRSWVNGWLINITYRNALYMEEPGKALRNIWAFALFADGGAWDNDWQVTPTPSVGLGGRQTNKKCVTDDILVLYNGPRRFVALLKTRIYDKEGTSEWPVVDVVFTIIFNKVKKSVIVLKDIKLLLETKDLDGLVDVEFSNRGEWDLGPETGVDKLESYVHFYHQLKAYTGEDPTSYGKEWHTKDSLMRKIQDDFVGDVAVIGPKDIGGVDHYGWKLSCPTSGNPFVGGSEAVFYNGLYKLPGEYEIVKGYPSTGEYSVMFPFDPADTDKCRVYYKNYIKEKEFPHDYSLAQMISADTVAATDLPGDYVGFAAFWPVLSDYTPDGWSLRLHSLIDVQEEDMVEYCSEPDIPFVIGEWDFMLDVDEAFRGVTVYGIVDYHDAIDEHTAATLPDYQEDGIYEYGTELLIDREVWFQLDEVFKPFDIYGAVHKETKRLVEFWEATDPKDLTPDTAVWPFPQAAIYAADFDGYCSFAERILVDGVLQYRDFPGVNPDYEIIDVMVTETFAGPILADTTLVLLKEFLTDLTSVTYTGTPATWYEGVNYLLDRERGLMTLLTAVDTGEILTVVWDTKGFRFLWNDKHEAAEWEQIDTAYAAPPEGSVIKVLESVRVVKSQVDVFTGNGEWEEFQLTHYPIISAQVFVDDAIQTEVTHYTLDKEKGTVTFTTAPADGDVIKIVYSLYSGRHEWTIVGRDARTVDSIGAALVTAAIKNKYLEIGTAGMDMSALDYPAVPNVLRKFGVGNAKIDYRDDIGRNALLDDWCETWPIKSSNIIGVGGPLANELTRYFNDFTQAFGAYSPYADASIADMIFAPSKWGRDPAVDRAVKDVYVAGELVTGYAVIAIYKDLDGTIGLVIWGETGQDTFHASKWFHDHIHDCVIQQIQEHVTAIILEIDYTVTCTLGGPAITVLQEVGTISEKYPTDC